METDMTREEAIENIKLIRFNAAITNANSFKKALDMAIEALSQPSFSSNLDEAAEEYRNFREKCGIKDPVMLNEIEEAYYVGAEWMAGQGAFYNTEVGWIDGPTVLDWPDDILDGFEMGDKVIVQIRKK